MKTSLNVLLLSVILLTGCTSDEKPAMFVEAPVSAPYWHMVKPGTLPSKNDLKSGEYRFASPDKCFELLEVFNAKTPREVAVVYEKVKSNIHMPDVEIDSIYSPIDDIILFSKGACNYVAPDDFHERLVSDNTKWNLFAQHAINNYDIYRKAGLYLDEVRKTIELEGLEQQRADKIKYLDEIKEKRSSVYKLINDNESLAEIFMNESVNPKAGKDNVIRIFTFLNEVEGFSYSSWSDTLTVEYDGGDKVSYDLSTREGKNALALQTNSHRYITLGGLIGGTDEALYALYIKPIDYSASNVKRDLEQAKNALSLALYKY